MSRAYDRALAKIRAATREYDAVRDRYRAGKIGDEEYLAARKAFANAEKDFDIAFDEESRK